MDIEYGVMHKGKFISVDSLDMAMSLAIDLKGKAWKRVWLNGEVVESKETYLTLSGHGPDINGVGQ